MDQLRDRYGADVIGYASHRTPTARQIAGDEGGEKGEDDG